MRVHKTSMRLSAALLALALGSAACGGDDGGDTGDNEGNASAIIKVNGAEPQNGLLPANTNETGGGRILQQLFTGLVSYDNEGKAVNEVAESIESDDAKTFTVKLKDDWTFTNGEKITAKTFVDSWNFAALSTNKQLNASFFEPIAGYADAHPEDPTPTTRTTRCRRRRRRPCRSQARRRHDVHHHARGPAVDLPAAPRLQRLRPAALRRPEGPQGLRREPDRQRPVHDGREWEHKVRIKTKVNPDYKGTNKPKNGGIENVFYADDAAAYADLQADKVDVLDQLPDAALETFQDDLGERAINQEVGVFQSFSFPLYQKAFQGPTAARSARRSRWRSTARPSPSRSSTAPGPRRRTSPRRSSRATTTASAATSAPSSPTRPRRCTTRPAASRATRCPCPTTPMVRTRRGSRPSATS
jgi:oligopeptide transport system substrate-binding protein